MPGLTYGPVQLINVVTKSYEHRAVYNGADYIYTEHTLWGSATVHPNTVVDAVNGGPYGTGVDAVAGIQAAFNQPRQDLTFEVGIVPFEAMTFDQDAQTGPVPIHFSAAVVYGAKTVECVFGIKWNTVLIGDTDPPPITSNRWVMTHQYDDQYRLTITTKGLATFRRDALLTWGTSADDYRSWLFVPIPIGYQRLLGPITLSQDGLAVDYTITDRRIIFESNDDKVAHMSVVASTRTINPNASDVFRTAIPALQAIAGRSIAEDVFKLNPLAQVEIGGLQATALAYDSLPRSYAILDITAYGTPTAEASDLVSAVLKIAMSRLEPVNTLFSGSTFSLEMDSDQRIAKGHWEYDLCPVNINQILNALVPKAGPNPEPIINVGTQALQKYVTQDAVTGYADAKETYQIQKGPGQDDETDNLGFIGDDILEVLVAATLQPAAPDLMTVNPVPAPNLEEAGPPTLTNPPEGRLE
jgi:hypothetical protein